MKSMKKRFSYIFLGALFLWLLFAQGCLKFRMTDKKAMVEFSKDTIPLQLKTATINSHSIHYAQTGADDKPTLLFIHGSPGSWISFKEYLKDKELRRRFRLISIDRPGFGNINYGDAISISAQATLIGPLIASLRNGKEMYVVGHSLGGPLTVKLAARYPEYVSGIVLLAASVDPGEEKKELWRPVLKVFPLCLLLPGSFRPSNVELWAFKKDILTMPADLNSITCPVIIIQGMQDPLVPPGNAFFAQQHLINARTVNMITLQDANHFIPWTRYAQVKEALLSLH
jgi:pimeloyl-ACP methyl ester carboxylesterase